MHTKPMAESDGTFGDWKLSSRPCPHCEQPGRLYWRNWESDCGGYEDVEHECLACGKLWWVEGPDA